MQAMIDELAKQAAESLGQVSGKETLASFWQEYLSKNGKIPALMKNLRTVAPEERPAMGKIINELKAKVQADYDAAAEQVKQAELAWKNSQDLVSRVNGEKPAAAPAGGTGGPDLAKRFSTDPAMKGNRLGKSTPKGQEVLDSRGNVIGHYR